MVNGWSLRNWWYFFLDKAFRPKCFFGPKITKPRPRRQKMRLHCCIFAVSNWRWFPSFFPCLIPGFPPDPLSGALWLSSDEPNTFSSKGFFSRHETFRCGAFCGEGSRQEGEDDLGDVVFFWLWLGIIWISLCGKETSNRQMDGNHNMSDRLLPTTKCPLQEFLFLMLIIWESSFILWQSLKSSSFFLSFFQIVESLKLPKPEICSSRVRREWLYQGQHFLLWWQQAACGTSADGRTSSVKQRCFPSSEAWSWFGKGGTSMDFDVPQSFEGPRGLSFWWFAPPKFNSWKSQCSKCQPQEPNRFWCHLSREAWLGQGGEVYEECHRLPSSPCLKILKVQHTDTFSRPKFSSQTDFYQWSMSSFKTEHPCPRLVRTMHLARCSVYIFLKLWNYEHAQQPILGVLFLSR